MFYWNSLAFSMIQRMVAMKLSLPCGSDGKESACDVGDLGSIPGLERPLEKDWLPTPVFLTGKTHGQRNLAIHGVAKSWTLLSG